MPQPFNGKYFDGLMSPAEALRMPMGTTIYYRLKGPGNCVQVQNQLTSAAAMQGKNVRLAKLYSFTQAGEPVYLIAMTTSEPSEQSAN